MYPIGNKTDTLYPFRGYYLWQGKYKYWKVSKKEKKWLAFHKWGPILFTESKTLLGVLKKIKKIEYLYQKKIEDYLKGVNEKKNPSRNQL